MHSSLKQVPLMAAALLAAALGSAQNADPNWPADREAGALPPQNRFSFNYRAAFNLRASFHHLGGVRPVSNPNGVATEQDHTYDDGYVLRDSGIGDGYTWNWGYANSSQVPGNDTIQFHSHRANGDGRINDVSDDPQHGAELVYERLIGRAGDGVWGVENGFNWINIGQQSTSSARITAQRTTDTYPLNDVVPPQPPYNGSFTGPGPLISDTPTRTVAPVDATIKGRHELEADLFGFRLGPYYEVPLNKHVQLHLSGGLALGLIDSRFSYREIGLAAGQAIGSARGSGHKTDFLFGGYAGADLSYSLGKGWSLFGGAQYQYLTAFTQKVNGRQARLDFSRAVYLRSGVSFEF